MRFYLLLSIAFLLLYSCRDSKKSSIHEHDIATKDKIKIDCDEVPELFPDFDSATNLIRNLSWKYSDDVVFNNSSWIKSAEFYSCDKETGYFIMCTENKCYIHDYVELNVWEDFKNSSDPGYYYNHFMRGNYQMYYRIE